MKIVTIFLSVGCLGFVIRALVEQYLHPDEAGFIENASLMILTPIITLMSMPCLETSHA